MNSLCVCLLNPSNFSWCCWAKVRMFGKSFLLLSASTGVILLFLHSFSRGFLDFSIHTSLWLIILWGPKHELYLPIALFKGTLSWSFSIIAIKNNLQPFLNYSFGPSSIHVDWVKLSQLLASAFVLGKGEYLYW